MQLQHQHRSTRLNQCELNKRIALIMHADVDMDIASMYEQDDDELLEPDSHHADRKHVHTPPSVWNTFQKRNLLQM